MLGGKDPIKCSTRELIFKLVNKREITHDRVHIFSH